MAFNAPDTVSQTYSKSTCAPLLNWLILTPEVASAPSWSETSAGQGQLEQKMKEIQDAFKQLKEANKELQADVKELKSAKKELQEQTSEMHQQLVEAFPAINKNFDEQAQGLADEVLRAKKAEAQMEKELREARLASRKIEKGMSENFDELKVQFLATEHNSIARMKNSRLPKTYGQIMSLHNIRTNKAIREFPGYICAIDGFNGTGPMEQATIHRVLTELGLSFTGTAEESREKLKEMIGMI